MRGVGREAGAVTQVEDRRRAAVMHVGRREIAEAAVVVGVIVPSQEVVADGARVFECAEPLGKRRPILDGAKLRLRERIVIAHARPRVAGRDAEVGEQQRDELAAHGRAAVGVNRELLRLDALLRAGLLDQALGQVGRSP